MSVMPDHWIRKLARENGMIKPFEVRLIRAVDNTFGCFCITFLGVAEGSDFIALDPTRLDVADQFIVGGQTGLPSILKLFRDRVGHQERYRQSLPWRS